MTTHTNTAPTDDAPAVQPGRFGWRVVDVVVAAVLAAAVGLIFWAWSLAGYPVWLALDAVSPGLSGLALGPWLLGGILGGLIIRKPGAALLVELLGACLEAVIGNHWGIGVIWSGLVQGLGAELIFAVFWYRGWKLGHAMLAGAGAAVGFWILQFGIENFAKTIQYNVIHLIACVLSGVVLAGALGWGLVRALAATGALNRFAAGRSAMEVDA